MFRRRKTLTCPAGMDDGNPHMVCPMPVTWTNAWYNRSGRISGEFEETKSMWVFPERQRRDHCNRKWSSNEDTEYVLFGSYPAVRNSDRYDPMTLPPCSAGGFVASSSIDDSFVETRPYRHKDEIPHAPEPRTPPFGYPQSARAAGDAGVIRRHINIDGNNKPKFALMDSSPHSR